MRQFGGDSRSTTHLLAALAIGLALLDAMLALPRRPEAADLPGVRAVVPDAGCAAASSVPSEILDMLDRD